MAFMSVRSSDTGTIYAGMLLGACALGVMPWRLTAYSVQVLCSARAATRGV